MRDFYWTIVKNIADTGSWGKCHAALITLIPAVFLLGLLLPHPPLYIYIPVCMILGNLVKHAVMFPICTRLMDRRQARHYAA